VGASLEKKRLRDEIVTVLTALEYELESARKVQLGMVPIDFSVPTTAGQLEIFATLEPARQIGGDLYAASDRGCSRVLHGSVRVAGAICNGHRRKLCSPNIH
jgi:phosphoserine phosphatase RsbU/P